jgi:hypothetical protein
MTGCDSLTEDCNIYYEVPSIPLPPLQTLS